MNKILKLSVLALLLAGTVSCEKENETDIDMSKIDFSNIEDLYKQPLPVIQKCVQGKWKWIMYISGVAGWITMDMGTVEITGDEIISYKGIQDFYWKEKEAYIYTVANIENYSTYVPHEKQSNNPICFFSHIKNDTLTLGGFMFMREPHVFIRMK